MAKVGLVTGRKAGLPGNSGSNLETEGTFYFCTTIIPYLWRM